MGRAHPHSRLHPPDAVLRATRALGHTLRPAGPPALPGQCLPLQREFSGCRWCTLMGTSVCFVFRERQEPAGEE